MLFESVQSLWLEKTSWWAAQPGCTPSQAWIWLAIPITLMLLWRLFCFTLVPAMCPNRPKELPYWLPFIGHTWAFAKDPVRLVEKGIDFTNRTREPFAIKVIGRTFYTITAPEHVAAVYKATTALSFDSFLNEALRGFGLDAASIDLAWHKPSPGDACYHDPNLLNPKQKPFVHWIKDTYRQALLPGEKMNHMVVQFHRYIEGNMQWNRVSSLAIQQFHSKGVVVLSLKDFSRRIMLEAITDSFFGSCLFQVEPNIVQYAAGFNDEAWMLVHRYPKILSGRVLHNRAKIMAALSKYRQIPKEVRTAGGEAWAIETVMTTGELLGMKNESNDTFLMLIHWAANANTTWLCFWLLSHILWDKSLLARVRCETESAFRNGSLDLAYLMSSCPLLESAFLEALRLGGGTVSVRGVTSPITIGGKLLQPGADVLILHRVLHSNDEVWGDSVDRFDPERFMKNKALASHASYRPFGGGSTYCPGRVIAKQEVFVFLAMLFHRLNIELAPGQTFPKLDDTQPSIGVTGPRQDMDLYVHISQRE